MSLFKKHKFHPPDNWRSFVICRRQGGEKDGYWMEPIIQSINPVMMNCSSCVNGKSVSNSKMIYTSNKCVGLQRKKTNLQEFIDNCLEWEANNPPPPTPPIKMYRGDEIEIEKHMLSHKGIVPLDKYIEIVTKCGASKDYINQLITKEPTQIEKASKQYTRIQEKFDTHVREKLSEQLGEIPSSSYGDLLQICQLGSVRKKQVVFTKEEIKEVFETYNMSKEWIDFLLEDDERFHAFLYTNYDVTLMLGMEWMERESMTIKGFITDVLKDKPNEKVTKPKKKKIAQIIRAQKRNTKSTIEMEPVSSIDREIYYNI